MVKEEGVLGVVVGGILGSIIGAAVGSDVKGVPSSAIGAAAGAVGVGLLGQFAPQMMGGEKAPAKEDKA